MGTTPPVTVLLQSTLDGEAVVSVYTTVPVCGDAVPVKVGVIVAVKTTVPLTLALDGDELSVVLVFVGLTIWVALPVAPEVAKRKFPSPLYDALTWVPGEALA